MKTKIVFTYWYAVIAAQNIKATFRTTPTIIPIGFGFYKINWF